MTTNLNTTGCQTWIFDDRGSCYQCQKKPIVNRDGKPYCTIHDPEYIQAKRKAQQAKWDKELIGKKAIWELEQARTKATAGLTLEELKMVTPTMIRKMLQEIKQ